MTEQALINPEILSWARKRIGLTADAFAKKMNIKNPKKIEAWENGDSLPTFKQAQTIAKITNIPFGYLFLERTPEDDVSIPDLRTVNNERRRELSVDAKELIQQIVVRQEWYKDYLLKLEVEKLPFVGKFSINSTIYEIVNDIRETIKVEIPTKGNWEDYYRDLIKGAENSRILVMRSGIVGANTKRKLNVSELRGFAISDEIAPVVFINSADAPSARLFTFIHELAHIWIGSSGISNVEDLHIEEERFCNMVAGEFLLPKQCLLDDWSDDSSLLENLVYFSTKFYVSKLVVAKRAFDNRLISKEKYRDYYQQVLREYTEKDNDDNSRGNYYFSSGARNSRLFSSAVIAEALSGRMLLRDAGKLLSVQPSNIRKYASTLDL